jgi:hypothetical protein
MYGGARSFEERRKREMDSRFNLAMQRIDTECALGHDYVLGFRRGLQRGFYGAAAVADSEHAAWLDLAAASLERSAKRLRGYLDGTTAAAQVLANEG